MGSSPGQLRAHPDAEPTRIRVMAYGHDSLVEKQLESPDEIADFLGRHPVTWVDVDGFADTAVLAAIGEIFKLHPLALEDVVNTHQRAKAEEYPGELFIVAHMVHLTPPEESATDEGAAAAAGAGAAAAGAAPSAGAAGAAAAQAPRLGARGGVDGTKTAATPRDWNHRGRLATFEQVSMFLGDNYVLTFQERVGDCFDPVRERIRAGRVRIRGGGAEYLTYALLDALTDSAFPLLERIDDALADLEDQVMESPGKATAHAVQAIKRDILSMLRIAWPHREAMDKLHRRDSDFLSDATKLYMRDCYDHSVQIIDLLQNYREIASSLMDLYHSSLGNRLNDIMKFLTVFATLFIPLTFIAGIYGMNFNPEASRWNMPELNWAYGYPMVWGVMLVVAMGMLLYFWRRGWIGDG
jgi:magnesium transporter